MEQATALPGRGAGPGRRPGSGKNDRTPAGPFNDLAGFFIRRPRMLPEERRNHDGHSFEAFYKKLRGYAESSGPFRNRETCGADWHRMQLPADGIKTCHRTARRLDGHHRGRRQQPLRRGVVPHDAARLPHGAAPRRQTAPLRTRPLRIPLRPRGSRAHPAHRRGACEIFHRKNYKSAADRYFCCDDSPARRLRRGEALDVEIL